MNTNKHEFLYKELSYILQGCFFAIRNEYGPGQKESVYVNLILEYLKHKDIFSEYEIGYLVNFSTQRLHIKRIIYTNDRKPFLKTHK